MKHLLLTTIAAVLLVGCAPDIPLWKAVADGDIKSVKQHLAVGADVNANSSGGWTQLTWAAHENRIEIGKLLIKKGADVNRRGDYGGDTALIKAIQGGHLEFVELLIINGVDVNAKSQGESDGITPLNVATQNGYKEIVELLITNGAEVNAISTMKTMKGVLQIGTTLDEAIKRNRPEIIDLLRKHGGKTGDWLNADKSIHDAAFDGNIEAIKQHLAAGTNVNAKDDNGRTPLLLAVEESHKEIAELLILKGANVNAKNQNEVTPLHWAAARGHKEIVELLIAKGADVNAKSDDGTTPLHFNNKEVVELLIAASADVNAKDDDSLTPLDWAVDEDSTETAALLRKHGGKTGEELKAAGK